MKLHWREFIFNCFIISRIKFLLHIFAKRRRFLLAPQVASIQSHIPFTTGSDVSLSFPNRITTEPDD